MSDTENNNNKLPVDKAAATAKRAPAKSAASAPAAAVGPAAGRSHRFRGLIEHIHETIAGPLNAAAGAVNA